MVRNSNKLFYLALTVTFFGLMGCAKDSGIMIAKDSTSIFETDECPKYTILTVQDDSNNELYRTYLQGATGFVPPSALASEIEKRALNYCSNKGKSLKKLKLTRTPRISFPGCFPRAELEFICIPMPNDKASSTKKLYEDLTHLKKLLDEGVITKDEFNQQKSKLLNQQ